MKALKTGLGLTAATIAVIAFPLSAQAEYLIPPSNSAATQYTEAVPTAGGPKTSGNSKHSQARSPSQVLGSGNAKKLDAQGPQGHAAAEVAAATAPSTIGGASGEAGDTSGQHEESQPGDGGNGGVGSETAPSGQTGGSAGGQAANPSSQQQDTSGSSGLGEVISQATGSSSSGDLGLLLPLIVLAALAWSVAFVLRQRRRPTE